MKAILTIILISCFTLMDAFPNEKGNHGDPFEVFAKPFPDHERIARLVKLVSAKVAVAELSEDLRDAIQAELFVLLVNGRIRYLEQDFLAPGSQSASEASFLGHGAWTLPNSGASIYLTQRIVAKDDASLGTVLLHEVLHHFFSESLSSDERFIQDLAVGIMSGKLTQATRTALETGYFPDSEDVSVRLIFDLWDRSVPGQSWLCGLDGSSENETHEPACERNAKTYLVDQIESIVDARGLCLSVGNIKRVMATVIRDSFLQEEDKAQASEDAIDRLLHSHPGLSQRLGTDCVL